VAVAACALAVADGAPSAEAASWHLVSSFGRNGVAGLPVRERLAEPPNQGAPSPPERYRSLLVQGPRGSVFAGGYAQSKPGAFLISRISATGRLVTSFGHGGLSVVPAIRWVKQAPPSMHALAGGGVLIVGIGRADELVAVRLTARGQPDSGFGHDGVAEYKVAGAHGFAIVTAAAVEPDGDILAVYQKELPQPPASSPGVPLGQGNGAIKYVRLLPSGALDGSFGKGGVLGATGEKVGFIEGESGTVGACAETLSPGGSLLVAYENFALEELNPAGAVVTSFGDDPTQQPGGTVTVFETKNDYHFCNGLFALAGGGVEGISGLESGLAGVEVSSLTPSGAPEAAFGTAGSTRIDVSTEAAAVAAGGETFAAGESRHKLALTGILPDGQPDPALGGAAGQRFAVQIPRGGGAVPGEEKPTWEVLPVTGGLFVRVDEELVRLAG
jgi:uncharacterized delta-60 repeat protein